MLLDPKGVHLSEGAFGTGSSRIYRRSRLGGRLSEWEDQPKQRHRGLEEPRRFVGRGVTEGTVNCSRSVRWAGTTESRALNTRTRRYTFLVQGAVGSH